MGALSTRPVYPLVERELERPAIGTGRSTTAPIAGRSGDGDRREADAQYGDNNEELDNRKAL
jgi:hypothetical protein